MKDPQLEQMKKAVKLFEQALKKAGPVNGTKDSLQTMADGRRYVQVDTDQDILDGHDVSEYPAIVKDYIKRRFRHTVVGAGENRAFIDARTGNEYTHPAKHVEASVFNGKMRAGTELDNLVDAGVFVENSGFQKKHPEFRADLICMM